MQCKYINRGRRPRWGAGILALGLMAGVSGCDQLLEVSNPNNISGEDVLRPSAALGLVNGTEALIAEGYSDILTSYSTVTDELTWVGSRDSYREHDQGNLHDPFNEFTDGQFQTFAQSRWLADESIKILTDLQAVDSLEDVTLMARAHVNRAMIYTYIADIFDDFPLTSDRQTGGPPLGEAGMGVLYDEAATSALTAIGIANAQGADAVETLAAALRARALHGRGVWNLVGNRTSLGFTPGNPATGLVQSTAARDAAVTALGLMNGIVTDFVYLHQYSAGTVACSICGWVNSREEMRIADTYATVDPVRSKKILGISLTDLIDVATISPIVVEVHAQFTSSPDYAPLRLVTAREMQLIIAEHALASGDMAGFATAINALRGLDGLTAWDVASPQVPAIDLLIHSRQTNLFLQGRRLADHYRFSDPSPEWLATARAISAPGTFFPIPVIECRANENIPDNC